MLCGQIVRSGSYGGMWLNDTYCNMAFSAAEPIGDKVRLPGVEESDEYFANDNARVCYPTEHAKDNGALRDDNGAGRWWLRSPGSLSYYAAYVYDHGYVNSDALNVYNYDAMARPVVVVALGLFN